MRNFEIYNQDMPHKNFDAGIDKNFAELDSLFKELSEKIDPLETWSMIKQIKKTQKESEGNPEKMYNKMQILKKEYAKKGIDSNKFDSLMWAISRTDLSKTHLKEQAPETAEKCKSFLDKFESKYGNEINFSDLCQDIKSKLAEDKKQNKTAGIINYIITKYFNGDKNEELENDIFDLIHNITIIGQINREKEEIEKDYI